MCWGYRVAPATVTTAIDAEDYELIAPLIGRIACAGRETAVLVNRRAVTRWLPTRYGMMLPNAGGRRELRWNARDDKLDKVELWSRLIRQRFAVPIDAYVESAPNETWHVGPEAWLIGFYDTEPHGGSVAITEGDGDRRIPILVDRAAAMAWLGAKQWDAIPCLARATRIRYAEADIFEAKALSTDARTKVPLARAA